MRQASRAKRGEGAEGVCVRRDAVRCCRWVSAKELQGRNSAGTPESSGKGYSFRNISTDSSKMISHPHIQWSVYRRTWCMSM